jgi:hypothetical protein
LIGARIGGNPWGMVSDDDPPPRAERTAERSTERSTERGAERGSDRADRPGGERAPSPEPEDHDAPDELPETIRHRLERLVPELVKKTFAAGLGAVFSTEEGIRKIARESLPEFAGYIASSADGAKDKVFDVIARETREFLTNLNVSEEIAKILTTLSFEIKTEIRFIPNSDRFIGAEPDVKASVRVKRADEGKPERAERRDDRAERPERPERPGDRKRFWQRDKDGDGPPGDDDDGPDR